MSKTYEQLKVERNSLRAMLNSNQNLKGHESYNMLRKQYEAICDQIKDLFRQDYQLRHGR